MKKVAFLLLGLFSFALGAMAQADKVEFSKQGGFYEESFSITLTCDNRHHIRYTTNGDTPTATSALYSDSLFLDESLYSKSNIYTIHNCIPFYYHHVSDVERAIVIRAAAFDENDSCVSPVVTNTYFISALGCDLHGLPVVSIATDSLSLFDYDTGIFIPGASYDPADSLQTGNYINTGREWERPINVEFYEPDNQGINQQCGLRIHGGASRLFQQKGLRLYAREEYGKKRFTHRFFPDSPIIKYKRLSLHPFRCSNWLQTGGQDYLSHRVASHLDVDALSVRQTVVFINGEYWGIYTLEESPDQRYLEDHYDVDLDQVNILKFWGVPQYGDPSDCQAFRRWIEQADLTQPEDSAYAFQRMDVPSFVDYILLETFSANLDWPVNNVLLWQAASGEPFRMIFYDGDGCFTRVDHHSLSEALSHNMSSLLMKKFFENEYFKLLFVNRFNELMTTWFSYDAMKAHLEEYRVAVEGEVPSQAARFGFPWNLQKWQTDMATADDFLRNRYTYFQTEIWDVFGLDEDMVYELSCYPNPTNGPIHVCLSAEQGSGIPIQIYDVMGRCIYAENRYFQKGQTAFTIHANYPQGLYLLKIGNQTKRIVIE